MVVTRAVFYCRSFYPRIGGLEKVAQLWAEALHSQGIFITVITSTANTEPDVFSFPVLRNAPFSRQLRAMRAASLIVHFDISLKGLPVTLLSRKPLIISHHTALASPGKRMPLKQRLKQYACHHWANANIACSQFIANSIRNCDVVHSPYEPAIFYNKQSVRRPASVLFVGRLVSIKGVDLLIEAVSMLPSNIRSKISVSIIGDGPERGQLEALVKTKQLGLNVYFAGSLPRLTVADLMNQHEVMVVPSREEPFGTVVLEGLACGCQMLVSDAGGLQEASGGFARTFQRNDAGSLKKSLGLLLTKAGEEMPQKSAAFYLSANTVTSTSTLLRKIFEKL